MVLRSRCADGLPRSEFMEDAVKLPRRKFLHLAAAAAALPNLSRIASPQAYPVRPVRWIVGFAAGGPQDIGARLLAQWLSEWLRQQLIISYSPSARRHIRIPVVVGATG